MAARGNAVASHISACAYPADMGAGTDAMTADVGVRTDAQHIYAQINGVSRHGRQENECEERRGECFHWMSSCRDNRKADIPPMAFVMRHQRAVATALFLSVLSTLSGSASNSERNCD
jgi:hypothetical protein